MANIDLQVVNSSGDLTEIKIGGTDAEKVVLTKEQVEALFGGLVIIDESIVNSQDNNYSIRVGKGDITLLPGTSGISIYLSPTVIENRISIADINAGGNQSAVTKEWVLAQINP